MYCDGRTAQHGLIQICVIVGIIFIVITPSSWTKPLLVEGDILVEALDDSEYVDFSSPQNRQLDNAVFDRKQRWEDGVVPYMYGKSFKNPVSRANIQTALNDLMTRTCIRFVLRTDQEDHIYFFQNRSQPNACSSYIGRQGKQQTIKLGKNCVKEVATIQHEVMHALGFFHEQSRSDRDRYVNIVWNNIALGYEHNFHDNRTDNLNTEYDYLSIMHYKHNAFARLNHLATITLKKDTAGTPTEFGSEMLSKLDIEKINRLYNCPQSEWSSEIYWNGDWAYGCDFRGNDLTIIRTSGDQCGPTCVRTPNCTHFTWSPAEGGTCNLKSGWKTKLNALAVSNKSLVCGVVSKSVEFVGQWRDNWAFGCDFSGNNLAREKVPGAQCSSACVSNPKCTHFSWTRYEDGTCQLKQGPINKENAIKISDNAAVCGVVEREVGGAIEWRDSWAHGCDFPGGDLTSMKMAGDECSPMCAITANCTQFAWTRVAGGTCHLKEGGRTKKDADKVSDNSMVCGLIESAGEWPVDWKGNWAEGCHFPENDLVNVKVPGDQCSRQCERTDGCTHFTWTNFQGGTCWMKQGTVKKESAVRVVHSGVVCGIL